MAYVPVNMPLSPLSGYSVGPPQPPIVPAPETNAMTEEVPFRAFGEVVAFEQLL